MSARRRAACSPLPHAGYLTCPVCGARGYATEATWLDDDRLLATYTPSCGHVLPETLVVREADEQAETGS